MEIDGLCSKGFHIAPGPVPRNQILRLIDRYERTVSPRWRLAPNPILDPVRYFALVGLIPATKSLDQVTIVARETAGAEVYWGALLVGWQGIRRQWPALANG